MKESRILSFQDYVNPNTGVGIVYGQGPLNIPVDFSNKLTITLNLNAQAHVLILKIKFYRSAKVVVSLAGCG